MVGGWYKDSLYCPVKTYDICIRADLHSRSLRWYVAAAVVCSLFLRQNSHLKFFPFRFHHITTSSFIFFYPFFVFSPFFFLFWWSLLHPVFPSPPPFSFCTGALSMPFYLFSLFVSFVNFVCPVQCWSDLIYRGRRTFGCSKTK